MNETKLGNPAVVGLGGFGMTTLILQFHNLFKELAGNQLLGTIAAWDLILCALLAWYLMAHVVFAEAGINLPLGKPWIKSSS
jgi:succinate-acetate transporter protein